MPRHLPAVQRAPYGFTDKKSSINPDAECVSVCWAYRSTEYSEARIIVNAGAPVSRQTVNLYLDFPGMAYVRCLIVRTTVTMRQLPQRQCRKTFLLRIGIE